VTVDVEIPLRRNLVFQTFWTGSASATLGQAVGTVAYPLAILTMTGSPGKAALFSAVQITGMLVAGLPVGSLADRYDSQRLALVAYAVSTMVACVVAIALIGGWLTLPLLVAVAAVLGAGQALGRATSMLLLRSIVPARQLTLALTQDEVRISGANLAGPALAGVLYGLDHVVPFAFTAAAFLFAFTAMAFVPAGVATVLLIMAVNTVAAGLELVVIVILRHQGVPPFEIGLAIGLGGAGGLAGAPLVKILHRLRPGVLLLLICGTEVLVFLLLAVPLGPWWVAGVLFTGMIAVPAMRVLGDILVIRRAPPERRGRVVAAATTLIALGMPVGVVGCGLLLQYLPAQGAMVTLAAAMGVATIYGLAHRELRHARWPEANPRN